MTEYEALVDAAIRDGRIPGSRRDHYLGMLERDPIAAASAIGALQPAPSRHPAAGSVQAARALTQDGGVPYPDHWLPEVVANAPADEGQATQPAPAVAFEDATALASATARGGAASGDVMRGLSGPTHADLGSYGLAGKDADR